MQMCVDVKSGPKFPFAETDDSYTGKTKSNVLHTSRTIQCTKHDYILPASDTTSRYTMRVHNS